MNNEQQELLDEVYKNFIDKTKGLNLNLEINRDIIVVEGPVYNATPRLLIKEEFINKCKTYPEFSEKWGLKIDERELSLEERVVIFNQKKEKGEIVIPEFKSVGDMNAWTNRLLDNDIPTKKITIIYNDKTLTNYE